MRKSSFPPWRDNTPSTGATPACGSCLGERRHRPPDLFHYYIKPRLQILDHFLFRCLRGGCPDLWRARDLVGVQGYKRSTLNFLGDKHAGPVALGCLFQQQDDFLKNALRQSVKRPG
ncbi:MAG: hypothetical protein ACYDDO_04135 [Acidiferrobacterales bacterium]